MSGAEIAAEVAWADAFVKATNALLNPTKSATAKVPTKSGGSYSYSYAPLPDIIDGIKPVLGEHGLTVVQDVVTTERDVGVVTCIWHKDGHVERFGPVVLPRSGDAQQIGSATTYLRRYGLCAALGIAADEDDDGQQASTEGAGSRSDTGKVASANPPSVAVSHAKSCTNPGMSDLRPDGGPMPAGKLRCLGCGHAFAEADVT